MDSLLIAMIGLQIADFITTKRGIEGGLTERNPVMLALMERVGLVPALLLSKAFAILGSVLLYLHAPPEVLGILVAFYALVVVNNLKHLRR